MPGSLVRHCLLEFAQACGYWVDDAIQPSHLLSPPFFSFPASGSFPNSQLFTWAPPWIRPLLTPHLLHPNPALPTLPPPEPLFCQFPGELCLWAKLRCQLHFRTTAQLSRKDAFLDRRFLAATWERLTFLRQLGLLSPQACRGGGMWGTCRANHGNCQSQDIGSGWFISNSVVREQAYLASSSLVPDGSWGGLMRMYKLQLENINWNRLCKKIK